MKTPCSAEGCADAIRSPCCLVTHELEASLTLMDPVILSQCQGVLLHPVLVLTNYQACLTGEGCFNLVLRGLSLDDQGSTVPCVVSVSFQGGLCESAGASPPLFQAYVPPDHQGNCRLDVWVLRTREQFCAVLSFAFGDILALLTTWWLEMADQSRPKRTGKYFSFSGASRKDSVKALRLSRSLNLKRATSRVCRRQVGTDLSDPCKLPRELGETSRSSLCLFVNILWRKASELVWTPPPSNSFWCSLCSRFLYGCVSFECLFISYASVEIVSYQ